MEIPLTVYAAVVVVGTVCVGLLSLLEPMRSWRQAFFSDPFFWVPVSAVWLLLMWPQQQEDAYFAGSELGIMRLARIGVFGLLAFAFVAYGLGRNQYVRGSRLGSYFFYIMVCFCSAFYSPSTLETVWKAFELLVLFLWAMELFIRSEGDMAYGRTLLRSMLFLVFTIVLCGMVGITLFPELSYFYLDDLSQIAAVSAGSIFPRVYPNTLSQMAGIILVIGLVSLVDDPDARVGSIALVVSGLFVLAASHSRTSILATAMILSFLLMRRKTMVFVVSLLAVAVVVAGVSTLLPLVEDFIYRGQTQAEFFSLTGRTVLWASGWQAFVDAPWLGHGFYAGHKALAPLVPIENVSSLDNMFLESLVNVGIVGTCFLAIFTGKLLLGSLRMDAREEAVESNWVRWERSVPFVLVGFVLVRALTGPSFQVLHPNLTIVFVCAVVVAIWQSNLDGMEFYDEAEEGLPGISDESSQLQVPAVSDQ